MAMDNQILTIPDLHGKTVWKNAFNPNYYKIVFLGDYVDALPPITDTDILDNLHNIIDLKKTYPDLVILLWGNHEQQYLFKPNVYPDSGFRPSMFSVLHKLLNVNKDLFQYAFQYQNYLWTHAGIHSGWWNYRFNTHHVKFDNIADTLNNEFNKKTLAITESKIETLFDCGRDRDGHNMVGGPLWVDRRTLWLNGISGYHQIVGHSNVSKIMSCPISKNKIQTGSITFCDCLDVVEQFHTVKI